MLRRRFSLAPALLAVLIVAPSALAAGGETSGPGVAPSTPATVLSPDRVIVEWAPGADHSARVEAREEAEVEFTSDLGNGRFQLVEVEPGQRANSAVRELEADPAVAVAERDGFSSLDSIPNDPLFGEQWGLQNTGAGIDGFSGAVAGADINVSGAWDRTTGTPSTVVADIDSGYRFNDPELGSVAWTNPQEAAGVGGVDDDGNGYVDDIHGYDFVGSDADNPSEDNDPTDDDLISGGHGVHTAGIIGAAGNNEVGITGVAQNVRIMPLRVCANSAAAGNEERCPFSSQIAAINYAGKMGARAANMSLGGTTFVESVRDAIAANPQTLFVISAGNDEEDNDSHPHYPCNYNPLAEGKSAVDNVICVAATNQADGLASFSDWGAESVDLGAPGTEILSTYPGIEQSFHDDFEANNFASTWSASGANGFGRAAAGDGPLTSFGMSDSPGEAPTPNAEYDTTLTTGVSIPSGTGACTLSGKRYRNPDPGSSFYYQVLSDGSSVFKNSKSEATPTFAMDPFSTTPILGLAGHSVKLRFGYTAGPSPTAENGIWFDDLELNCYEPTSAPLSYEFLQGTSMAAPHVTGAAALLFSRKPSATVTEVREALLAGVDPVASLAGKTTSGGRLDVSKAMDILEAPQPPQLTSTVPPSPANENHPKIVGTAEAGSTVRIYAGTTCSEALAATGTAAELEAPGIAVTVPDNSVSQFSATATDAAEHTSSCSAPVSYTESTPDTEAPEAPKLTSTEPESPEEDAEPRFLGSAEDGSTVKIYLGAECMPPALATGSAAELSSPGITVPVPLNATSKFTATATDVAMNTSLCSEPIEYTEDSSSETEVVKGPPDEAEEAEEARKRLEKPTVLNPPPPPAPLCTVPKLTGMTLARAKTALAAEHCSLGTVRRRKAQRGRRRGPLVVKASNPAVGAQPVNGKVDLTLTPKRKPKKHHH